MSRTVFINHMLRWLRERLWRRSITRDIHDELRFHVEQRTAEYQRAGLGHKEAERRARQRFGNMGRMVEACHEVRHVRFPKENRMESIWRDIRIGTRTLRHTPGFAIVAILTLALGIGANTAVFTVLNSVLLAPLPYDQPERLVQMYTAWDGFPESRGVLSGPDFVDYRNQVDAFEHLAVLYTYRERGLDIAGPDGIPRRIRALPVSSGYFEVFRAPPLFGRTFTRDEEREETRLVVLSHRLWIDQTNGDRDVLGRSMTMDGEAYTVVGVMPPHFLDVIAGEIDVWIPLDLQPDGFYNSRGNTYLTGVGRLANNVTVAQAQAQLDVVAAQLKERYPDTNEERYARIHPMFEEVVGGSKTMIFVLMGAAGLVLLIACVNVANLFLARGVARQREFAVRAALGARRGRLVSQLVSEGLILAAIGGGVGLIVALLGVEFLLAISPESLARANEVSFNLTLLAFAGGLVIVTGLLFGIAPALGSARIHLTDALRNSTRGATGSTRTRFLRIALVTSQMALALVLLVGAGLLMKSFVNLQRANPGIAPENVMTFEVHLPEARYADPEERIRFHQTFQDQLRTIPGVTASGATSWLPVAGRYHSWSMAWRSGNEEVERRSAQNRVIEGDYFDALGIPLLRGRTFQASDRLDAPAVAIISRSAAELAFADTDPLGQEIGAAGQWRTVVGIVSDVAVDHRGTVQPTIYIPHTEFGHNRNWALIQVVGTTGRQDDLLGAVRRELARIDSDLVVYHPRSMTAIMRRQVAQDRFALTLMGVFAAIAVTLAAVGIYGVLSYSVSQRSREIGIRMALGARAEQVRRIVAGQGAMIAAVGIALGTAVAFGASRLLESMVFEVSVRDPLIFTLVPAVLGAVAVLAGYLPARRATEVDPVESLRRE